MNLSEDLSVDKELFSGVYEGKYRLPENIFIDKNILLINFIYYKFKQYLCK